MFIILLLRIIVLLGFMIGNIIFIIRFGIILVKDRYLLKIGSWPITINDNGAKIYVTGNKDYIDYHFANVGK